MCQEKVRSTNLPIDQPAHSSRLLDGSSAGGENIIDLFEHFGPRLIMLIPRLLVRKTCMGEPQIRSSPARGEFDGYDRFGPLGSACPCQPCHLDGTSRFWAAGKRRTGSVNPSAACH